MSVRHGWRNGERKEGRERGRGERGGDRSEIERYIIPFYLTARLMWQVQLHQRYAAVALISIKLYNILEREIVVATCWRYRVELFSHGAFMFSHTSKTMPHHLTSFNADSPR